MSPQIHPHPVILAAPPTWTQLRMLTSRWHGTQWSKVTTEWSKAVRSEICQSPHHQPQTFPIVESQVSMIFFETWPENKHMGSTNLPETNKKVHPEKLKVGRWFISFWEISYFQGAFAVRFGWRIFSISQVLHGASQLGSYIFLCPETVQLAAMCVATFDITLDFPGPWQWCSEWELQNCHWETLGWIQISMTKGPAPTIFLPSGHKHTPRKFNNSPLKKWCLEDHFKSLSFLGLLMFRAMLNFQGVGPSMFSKKTGHLAMKNNHPECIFSTIISIPPPAAFTHR